MLSKGVEENKKNKKVYFYFKVTFILNVSELLFVNQTI